MTTNVTVAISPTYRMVIEERNYTIQKRHIIDPTKAPGYKPIEPAPPLREDWRDVAFFPLNSAGFNSAMQYVIVRSVPDDVTTLTGLVAAYIAEAARLSTLISAAFQTESGAIGANG